MKRLVMLLFVSVFMEPGSGSVAQELLVPPAGGSHNGPPQLEMPTLSEMGSAARGSGTRQTLPGMELPESGADTSGHPNWASQPESIRAGDLQPGLQPFMTGNEYPMADCRPALLESTGTWLRRGYWYTEIDAVLMDLIWRRDNSLLMVQQTSNNTFNPLLLGGGRQGAEGMPRLKLGRFLFRDHENRDHAAELIFYGGGQWSRGGRLDAVNGGSLVVVNDGGNTSFDGATSSEYDYDTRFNSFELNYTVKSRMQKDRMELEPNGAWVRRAQPTLSRSLTAGIRYFDLSEDFDWNAFGIDNDGLSTTAPQTGNYTVRTDNDMIGSQLGIGWTYETARWSLGLHGKGGMYINHTDVDSRFEVTGGVTSGSTDITQDNLSFVTEAAILGKWHLRPNLSLRAGAEILFATSVAHASEQMNFIPVSTSQEVARGDSTFMGGTIGFEGYW